MREQILQSEKHDEVRAAVREQYGKVAKGGESGCCAPSCCSPDTGASLKMGYSKEDLEAVPEGADMGLGCGNPTAIAALRPGERVLDLGAGGGFDCFLAAKKVGEEGAVIGVDMTAEMVAKARENARRAGTTNVEFRLGEIEHLPVADREVDVILSNCVINLSPDKKAVFREAFRVLKPGGRLAISDVVATAAMPAELAHDAASLTRCISGATPVEALRAHLRDAGFTDIRVETKEESRAVISDWLPGSRAGDFVASACIEATKPR